MTEFWAVLEYADSALHEQSGELLSELIEIAQASSTTAHAVMLIGQQEELPDVTMLPNLGVQHLYLLMHPRLHTYSTALYVSTLAWLLQQRQPTLVVTSATPNGRDWAPRLAAQLHLPYIPNCLGIEWHDDAVFALRSMYEGRAYVQTRTEQRGRTALVTLVPGVRGVRGTSTEMQDAATRTQLEITHLQPELLEDEQQHRIRRVALQAPSPEEVELEAAERIVAGGRGVGQSGFSTIATFAHRLGAAVGATRVATDLGWVEHARQIGATGKIVHPKLYIACGISGAAQHTSGMTEAQTVVAINPDRSAPIFALADLGLLGDANQILPLAANLLDTES